MFVRIFKNAINKERDDALHDNTRCSYITDLY